MPLRDFLSSTWDHIQDNLFPWLREELGPLTDLHKRVIVTLELARVETLVGEWRGLPGRPPSDRAALARAFVAKAVMSIPTTKMLIERLTADKQLSRLCGWERPGQVPDGSTFSRAFARFARSDLPCRRNRSASAAGPRRARWSRTSRGGSSVKPPCRSRRCRTICRRTARLEP